MRQRQWTVASATRQGTSHEKFGTPCQDAVHHERGTLLRTGQSFVTAALADGAGSSAHAKQAAEIAAREAARKARELLEASNGDGEQETKKALKGAFNAARKGIEETAAKDGCPISWYHTTLLLVIHTGDLLGTAHIGDGGIIRRDRAGKYELLSAPEQGEYANETRFITDPNLGEAWRMTTTPGGAGDQVALFSDGVQRIVLDYADGHPKPHEPFWNGIFGWLETRKGSDQATKELEEFVQSKAVSSRTQDDVSLVLVELKETQP